MSEVTRLDEWVTRSAERRPDAIAVVLGDRSISYGLLEETSNRLAHALRDSGCREGDRVALLADKSPESLTAILAVYKAGAILVPLDPDSPSVRQARILRSCDPHCVLSEAGAGAAARARRLREEGALRPADRLAWMGTASEAADQGVDSLLFAWDYVATCEATPVPRDASNDAAAHILYTSGSTGEPKGVVVLHRGAVRFVEWALRHFGIGSDERLSGLSPLHFDLSTFDIFGAFASGAELHLISRELTLLPKHLADCIRNSELTQLFAVPSVLNYMARFDVVKQDDFPALRRLLWCGEVLPTPSLVYWMQRLPDVTFTNLYGPTETTIASSYYDVPTCPEDDRAEIPIGQACDGEELLVLDENLEPPAFGAIGELYIGGVGLAMGYWGDPERTAAAFVEHPHGKGRIYRTGDLARLDDNGLVYFLGRTDSQIKSRGFRIELGEIESAVAATGLALESVVTAVQTSGFEGQQICCAYVPVVAGENGANHGDNGPEVLRGELRRLLPAYMLPTRWIRCEQLPRNASGKLDRKRVKTLFEEGLTEAHAAPA